MILFFNREISVCMSHVRLWDHPNRKR